MANGNQASYTAIGFTVLAGVAAIAAALIYIGGMRGTKDECFAETYFRNPVSGLSEGSVVNFRGVKVGEVRGISFVGAVYDDCAENDLQTVLVRMSFDPKLCRQGHGELNDRIRALVARGLHATVTPSGITGLSRIELNFPKDEIRDEPISWKPRIICIPPGVSLLDGLSDTATRLMRQIDRMDFRSVYSNLLAITASGANLTAAADEIVQSHRGSIAQAVANFEAASAELTELVRTVKENPSLLLRSNDAEPLPETAR